MCNQIISADSLVVRNKEHLVDVVKKACGYLSIGLDKVTDGDQQEAARLLQKSPLARVFRVGYGTALELKWKADKWLKESWYSKQSLDFGFWGEDLGGMLQGVLKKRPLFYAGLSADEPYREFKTLEDVALCHEALDSVIAMDNLLSLLFPESPVVFPVQTYLPLTFKNLILTCWARHHLEISGDIDPLTIEELRMLFNDLWKESAKPHGVDPETKQAFFNWLQVRSGLSADEFQGSAASTLDSLFVELDEEYGSVSHEDLDPRYIKHFLVTH
jgi:hypothetical protein